MAKKLKQKLKLKNLIPAVIIALLLSGCNTGAAPNITSSTPATSEKTPESSAISTAPNEQTNIDVDKLVQPISHVDKMKGKTIEFNETTHDIGSPKRSDWFKHIAVVRSYAELNAIYDVEALNNHNYPSYNEGFFKNNVLVVLFISRASFVQTYSIENVTTKDNILYINMVNTVFPDDLRFLQIETCFSTFITVSKADMENITNVVVCEK